jgi:iron-sulfur cluster assembly protein
MISISELASQKVKQTLQKRGKGQGIKVGVRTTGCSGLAYTLEFVDTELSTDIVYESNDVKIFVDPKHLPYVMYMKMDWKKQGLNEGFDFINPSEKSRCGCGESFTV